MYVKTAVDGVMGSLRHNGQMWTKSRLRQSIRRKMKVLKREYTPIRGCSSFWSWLWFTADYPLGTMYGDDRANWFKYCGSAVRVLIRRRFGFSTDLGYHRDELNTWTYLLLHLILLVAFTFLGIEIMLILLLK